MHFAAPTDIQRNTTSIEIVAESFHRWNYSLQRRTISQLDSDIHNVLEDGKACRKVLERISKNWKFLKATVFSFCAKLSGSKKRFSYRN